MGDLASRNRTQSRYSRCDVWSGFPINVQYITIQVVDLTVPVRYHRRSHRKRFGRRERGLKIIVWQDNERVTLTVKSKAGVVVNGLPQRHTVAEMQRSNPTSNVGKRTLVVTHDRQVYRVEIGAQCVNKIHCVRDPLRRMQSIL